MKKYIDDGEQQAIVVEMMPRHTGGTDTVSWVGQVFMPQMISCKVSLCPSFTSWTIRAWKCSLPVMKSTKLCMETPSLLKVVFSSDRQPSHLTASHFSSYNLLTNQSEKTLLFNFMYAVES